MEDGGVRGGEVALSDQLLSRCMCKYWLIKWLYRKHSLGDGILEWAQNSAGTVSRESLPKSREAGHSTCCFESGTLRLSLKADRLGKMPKSVACGLCCSNSSVYVDYSHSPTHSWDFKREFLSAGSKYSVGRGSMVNVKSLYRQIGQTFYRPLSSRVLSASLCTLFCFSRLVFLPCSP